MRYRTVEIFLTTLTKYVCEDYYYFFEIFCFVTTDHSVGVAANDAIEPNRIFIVPYNRQ